MAAKGKILVIDDSLLVQNYLNKILTNLPDLEQCGSATNGQLGYQKILSCKPDVIILDLEMDRGDGLFVIGEITKNIPPSERPYIIIHSTRAKPGDPLFTEAMSYGFCDFVLKAEGRPEEILATARESLLLKIRGAVRVRRERELLIHPAQFVPRPIGALNFGPPPINTDLIPEGLESLPKILKGFAARPQILIIGASTGGPNVVRNICKELNGIKIPVAVIQHMPETFTKSFAEELGKVSGQPSVEISHNMPLEKGRIHVFPGGIHGRLNAYGHLFVFYADRQNYAAHPFKPSINLAIEHLMGSFTGKAIGVILSGMGRDGALGMKALHQAGSLIIGQDKNSSAIWGMPGAAVSEHAVDILLSESEIGQGVYESLKHFDLF